MCIQITRKVVQIHGNIATMDDGRKVRTGILKDVAIGDYLEVYGDIAIEKKDKQKNVQRRVV